MCVGSVHVCNDEIYVLLCVCNIGMIIVQKQVCAWL